MNAPRRPPRRKIDGVLLLDKDKGLTSNAALQKVRFMFNAAKAGHTGTLDPMATGLLPICLGEATKFSSQMLEADKSYQAELMLGVTTDTADAEGQRLLTRPVNVSDVALGKVLEQFIGELDQIPPMYSAIKRDGRPLYEYARQGIELERQSRRICISDLQLHGFDGVRVQIEVACSKGTYIRTLAADIGEVLGCGAHLTALRRTRIGFLDLSAALTLQKLTALDDPGRDGLLAPVDTLLRDLPQTSLNVEDTCRFSHGQPVIVSLPVQGECRVYAVGGRFLGLGEFCGDSVLHPRRLVGQGAEQAATS